MTTPYPRSAGLIGAKGGQGTTVIAAALALLLAEREPTLLVGSDDTAAALGLPVGQGLARVAPGLDLLDGEPPAGRSIPEERLVLVDGRPAATTLLVTRACYLSLRRAVALSIAPAGIVLVEEPGRALSRLDVSRTIGAPLAAVVPLSPEVARAVDSGLLAERLPRCLRDALAPLAAQLAPSPAPRVVLPD